MAFYGWGSTAPGQQPLRGGSLLFITQFPGTPGIHFIDLKRMNGWIDHGATQWFWTLNVVTICILSFCLSYHVRSGTGMVIRACKPKSIKIGLFEHFSVEVSFNSEKN